MKISCVFLDRDGVLHPHIPSDCPKSADGLMLLAAEARAHLDRCYYATETTGENSPRRKPPSPAL